MGRYLTSSLVLVTILLIGLVYGVVMYHYKLFPYEHVKQTQDYLSNENAYSTWSIGIYTGSTPFDLSDGDHILNPVLTGKDVNDINARFVADPFLVIKDGTYYMFFEAMNSETKQGDIGFAQSEDGVKWEYGGIILDENFHLSYPYVFESDGTYYLIPESHEDMSVRLYVADPFPNAWKHVGNLLNGHPYADSSIFRYDNKWWLYVYVPDTASLNLFYSEELLTGWTPHPLNPIVKSNKHIARPGGRVIEYDGHMYRLTQDDDPQYGIQVFVFEISELSTDSYAEKILSETPVVKMTGKGWNASGMHHVDVLSDGDGWIAAVDGKSK